MTTPAPNEAALPPEPFQGLSSWLRLTARNHPADAPTLIAWAKEAEAFIADRAARALTQGEPASLTDEKILHLRDTHVGEPTAGHPLDASDWINFAHAVLLAATPVEPAGWQDVLKRAKDGLGAGGRSHGDQEFIDYGAALIDHIEERLAAVASAQAPGEPTGWQPIETAPKTGRTLLLGYFNACGKWRTLCGQWFTDAVIQEEWTNSDVHEAGWFETSVECDDEDSGCWPTDPTHWMPLPASPGAAA